MDEKVLITEDVLKNAITTSVYEAWKELNKDKVETPVSAEEKQAGYVFSKMLSSMKKNDFATIKTLAPNLEGTDNIGGYLVPRIVQEKILSVVGTYGQARELFAKIPVSKTGKMSIPKYGGGVTAYWVGENAQIDDSRASFSVVNIDTKKLAAIVAISNELLEDAIVDIGDFVIEKVGEAFGIKEDEAFFNGTTPFTGLFKLNRSNFGNQVPLGDAANDLTYEMLVDMVFGIDQKHLKGAVWMMHRTWLAAIRKIKDTTGQPIFYPANDGSVGTLLGYPVVLVEAAPPATSVTNNLPVIILGNPKNTYYGVKRELQVSILSEATIEGISLAQYDLTGIRVTERVAFHTGLVEKYSCLYGVVSG